MPTIKISSKVDADAWEELRALAAESHQSISGLLSEAVIGFTLGMVLQISFAAPLMAGEQIAG